jgi:hypothetical protein
METSQMANVYVEPRPKGRDGTAITHYVLELAGDLPVAGATPTYSTQELAIADAKKLGHHPNVARVRHTDKGNPDHWRRA